VKAEQTTGAKAPAHKEVAQARHGYRNEVNWEGGSGRHEDPPLGHWQLKGRQPYSNQPPEETASPAASEEYAEGNRAERSGRNLDQFERVKRRP
jgi:hypothetical protein